MSQLRGVAHLITLDEFKIEPTQNGKQKLTIKASLMARFNKQLNKAEYDRISFTTEQNFLIEPILALGLPPGQCDRNNKIFLDIPFRKLYFVNYQGRNGEGIQGYADIDGEISICYPPPPKPQRQGGYQNQGGGYQNQGPAQYQQPGPQQGGYQQPYQPPQQLQGVYGPPSLQQQPYAPQGPAPDGQWQQPPMQPPMQPIPQGQPQPAGYQPPQQAQPWQGGQPPMQQQQQYQPPQQGGYQPPMQPPMQQQGPPGYPAQGPAPQAGPAGPPPDPYSE